MGLDEGIGHGEVCYEFGHENRKVVVMKGLSMSRGNILLILSRHYKK